MKFVVCHQSGHYANQCPNKKKKDKGKPQIAASTEVDVFTDRFKSEFSSIAYLSSSATDNGASSHVIGAREYFTRLTKKDLDFHIELGNNAKCRVASVGTIMFQR